eukprot:jgi/Botrbrau1/13710/Bobra.250_2s0008.1
MIRSCTNRSPAFVDLPGIRQNCQRLNYCNFRLMQQLALGKDSEFEVSVMGSSYNLCRL